MKTAMVVQHVRHFLRLAWCMVSRNLFWIMWAFLVGALVGITPIVTGGR